VIIIVLNKVFDSPQISVDATSVSFDLNAVGYQSNQVIYGEKTITITNTGNVPQIFSIFVPNKNDGTANANSRLTDSPDFYYKIKSDGTVDWQHYLKPGQSFTFTLTVNLIYQTNMQTSYTDTGYIYSLSRSCSGIYLASCYSTAGWSQPFTITTTVKK